MMETRKVGVLCMKRLDGRGTQRNSWQVAPWWYKRARVEWCGDSLLSKVLKEDLISVSSKSDPVMSIELGLEEMVATGEHHVCLCSTSGLYRK